MIDKSSLSHILSFVTKDSENISERLFERYTSAEEMFSEDTETLCEVMGSPDAAVFLKLALSLAKRRIRDSPYRRGNRGISIRAILLRG